MNKFLKYSLVYVLLVAFFVSTTGVFYVVHHCNNEHKDYIFFSSSSAKANCTHHHHHTKTGQESQIPCTCNFPHAHEQITDEACCVNHYHFAKLESDFIYSSSDTPSLSIPMLCILFTNTDLISIYREYIRLKFFDFPPIKFSDGTAFLSSICQFLI
ncbi:MAG: hypothetical protein RSC04_03015 [Bacteroidales bacterium]